ncbi:MAG TPA: ABC transporter permease subunit [Bryobacteraceae bacterium]|jgi:ABC-type transport system involved in multi-copper enzyme maturation permease subunit
MNKTANTTAALVRDTFREAFARRIFWGFFGCCSALLLFLMFIMRIDVVQGAIATVTIFGRNTTSSDVEGLVQQTQSVIAMVLYFAGMALSVFASAGLVAAVFEPGRIELLLSKPVSRTHLLLGRYLGNVLVVAANIVYLVAGSWIIFGVKTNVWGAGFLISSLCTIFIFAVLLAVLVLVGVLWDSSAVAIMATFAIMIITPILAQKATIERLLSSEWSRVVVRFLYYVLPKTSDVSVIIRHMILNQPIESWMPVWSTAIFGAVVLGLGLWRFQRRSF